MKKYSTIIFWVFCVFSTVNTGMAEPECLHENEKILIKSGGKVLLQMQYGTAFGGKAAYKPYFDILATPAGRNILRDGPADHPHHHGLMFAIMVDGVNFWEEHGSVVGKEVFQKSGFYCAIASKKYGQQDISTATLEIPLLWVNDKTNVLIREDRKVVLLPDLAADAVVVDWTSTLSLPEGRIDARLEGLSYHGLGMRFDASMDSGGRFFSDTDSTDTDDVSLRECRWAAYTASLHGEPVTVAVFDSNKNVRKMLVFTMGGDGKTFAYLSATGNLHREPLVLTRDKQITFRYGIAVWEGERKMEDVEKTYRIWLESTR